MSEPDLSAAIVKYEKAYRDTKQQRDELLDAAKELLSNLSANDDEGLIEHAEPVMKLRAIIAKVES
jgi:recombinational DNA repair ATPase RecF